MSLHCTHNIMSETERLPSLVFCVGSEPAAAELPGHSFQYDFVRSRFCAASFLGAAVSGVVLAPLRAWLEGLGSPWRPRPGQLVVLRDQGFSALPRGPCGRCGLRGLRLMQSGWALAGHRYSFCPVSRLLRWENLCRRILWWAETSFARRVLSISSRAACSRALDPPLMTGA